MDLIEGIDDGSCEGLDEIDINDPLWINTFHSLTRSVRHLHTPYAALCAFALQRILH